VKVFGEALGDVGLRPDQRTELENLAALAEQRHSSMADGHKEMMLAVADQVERGALDKASLQPKLDRIQADFEAVRPADNAALVRVHAILDASQRNAFASALEARMKSRHHTWGGHGDKAKHDEQKPSAPAEGAGPGSGRGPRAWKELADELKLTDAQKLAVFQSMKAAHDAADSDGHHAGRSPMGGPGMFGKKALEAFRSDAFDPNAFAPPGDKIGAQASGVDRMLSLAQGVLPILTPEQRKLAADRIRSMAANGAEGPFGH
jgi:Spy/CpxP family protein refolding chaperone